MSSSNSRRTSGLARAVRKLSLSTFVVATFVAYAVHERFAGPRPAAATQPAAPPAAAAEPTAAPTARPTQAPTTAPEPTAAPAPIARGGYRDGTYTGAEIDAYYGLVQVQAKIQQGKIMDVQFLEYPNDRRTSIRINNQVMPYLTSEAIQAQNAQVDIISGATLTSEAFVQSLQSALDAAKSTV